MTSNFYTEFKLPFNLKFRSALNIDNYYNRNMSYDSAVHGSDQLAPYGVTVKTNGGYAERYDLTQRSTTWNNVLSENGRSETNTPSTPFLARNGINGTTIMSKAGDQA